MLPVQIVSRTQTGRDAQGFTEGERRVWDYLTQNPDAITMSVRKLGEATDTSKTTAADILRRFKGPKQ